MGVDYKKLEILRKKTRLTILEKIKILKMKWEAEDNTRIINQKEHCHLGVDFSEADAYEYERRLRRLRKFGRGKGELE